MSSHRITPLVPVTDVMKAAAFFTETLGFHTRVAEPHYAYLTFGAGAIRLQRCAPDADMTDERRQLAVYVDVEGDIDALWARLDPGVSKLPPGHVRAPFDQDYGQREFHVIYEALLLFFGTPIRGAGGGG